MVNKLPRRGVRIELEQVARANPEARSLIAIDADQAAASRLSAGDFAWESAPAAWQRSVHELAR